MITGADIRKFRRQLGWTQGQVAKKIGMSQAALSLIEKGRTAVSDDHVTRLRSAFAGSDVRPSFDEFVQELNASRSSVADAGRISQKHYLTLPVWRWEEGLDLNRPFAPDQAVDMITVRPGKGAILAFEMPMSGDQWAKDEIIAFEQCDQADLHHRDLCLIHYQPPRSSTPRTAIAMAHVLTVNRGKSFQLQPVSPGGPVYAVADLTLRAVHHEFCRIRYAS